MRVTLIQGGGIGFDLTAAMTRILQAANVAIEFEEFLAGGEAEKKDQQPLPREMFDSIKKNGLALKTKLMPSPRDSRHNYNIEIRKRLGVFAAVRPIKNIKGLAARFQNVDMLIVRELTEDLYAAIEHEIVPGVVQSIKVVTEAANRRFFEFAFDLAKSLGRKTVHCVHKANILKQADGLVLEAFRKVAQKTPELTPKEIIVDNCCMQMVSRPHQFDVLVMGNLYGDIVSDLAAGLVGGISATHGINVGDGFKIYEALHGASHDQVKPNQANPLPLVLPLIDLLEASGQKEPAQRIMNAVEKVLTETSLRPPDLGGETGTREFTSAIIEAMG